jgi:MarR family 2-MHQ and catechol resistance regulon transcriptional repressor
MGTKYRGKQEEVRALNSFIKLMRAAESVMNRTQQRLKEYNLTASQFGAMESLYHLGPMCQRDVGAKLLKSGGNITMVVDNLEKRDLVTRKRDTGDRRFITVDLTPAGRKLIEEIFPVQLAGIVEDMSVLSDAEHEQFGALCKRLGFKEAN